GRTGGTVTSPALPAVTATATARPGRGRDGRVPSAFALLLAEDAVDPLEHSCGGPQFVVVDALQRLCPAVLPERLAGFDFALAAPRRFDDDDPAVGVGAGPFDEVGFAEV